MIRKWTPYWRIIAPKPLKRPEKPSSCIGSITWHWLFGGHLKDCGEAVSHTLISSEDGHNFPAGVQVINNAPCALWESNWSRKSWSRSVNAWRCSLWSTVSRGKSRASAVRWPASDAAWAYKISLMRTCCNTASDNKNGMLRRQQYCFNSRLVLAQARQVGELGISWDCTSEPLVFAVGCFHHLEIITHNAWYATVKVPEATGPVQLSWWCNAPPSG